jgi:hypothetical protein
MTRWEGKPITEGEMDILLWVIVAIIMLAVVYGSFGQKIETTQSGGRGKSAEALS